MDFSWTEEQEIWRRAVRDFAQKKIKPKVRDINANKKIGVRSYSIGAEGTMNIMRIIIARELPGKDFLPYRQ